LYVEGSKPVLGMVEEVIEVGTDSTAPSSINQPGEDDDNDDD
jgi:hypothetical protein